MNTTNMVYGIDLGTTNSCIALIDEYSKPVVNPNSEGLNTTPSVVSYEKGSNNPFVGEVAKEALMSDPTRTVAFIKREIGNDNFQSKCEIPESPVVVSAYILKKLVDDANSFNNSAVKDVVITCPAYFGTKEREQTKQAGKIAGLNVLSIINEPTAAAISYGIKATDNKTILVYDLGGGTFDVSVIQAKGGNIDVIATGGDHRLGGVDWDTLLAKYIAKKADININFDSEVKEEEFLSIKNVLLLNAEKGKKMLTSVVEVTVNIPYKGETKRITINRDTFDQLTSVLLDQTIEKVHEVIDIAKSKGISAIDEVLLVGGSTRMPQVKKRVDKDLNCNANISDPDMAVAKGAALYAKNIKNQGTGRGLGGDKINDTSANSYGIECFAFEDDILVVQNLIVSQSPVVCTGQHVFQTRFDGQSSVSLPVYEGTSQNDTIDPLDATLLETHNLDLKRGYPKGTPVIVFFDRTFEGILKVHAEAEGNYLDFELKLKGVLSTEEVKKEMDRLRNIKVG